MRLPPFTAHVVALAHGSLVGATLLLAALALVAMLLASRRAPAAPEDVDEPLQRLSGFHIFGPDEDDEPRVHIPVRGARTEPVVPAAVAHVTAPDDHTSRALDRVSAFAVREPYAPTVRWNALPPDVRPPAPTPDRERAELPLDGDILLVEDDVAIADLYRMLLHAKGYCSRHALDGVEGIAMVRTERPALILLDMMMPRMDGIQFLEALRSWPKTSAVPVVVLTNTDNLHLVDRAMSLGAVEYLVKAQTRPQVLAGALPHWLRGNRALSSVASGS